MNRLANAILESGALIVKSKPAFKWASGIRSPIYCDLRLLIGRPREREIIIRALVRKIEALKPRPQVIAGTATAGIPWAAWVAARLKLPMVYVRTKAKFHGTSRQIEGGPVRGKKTVLIEDMVTTGGSSLAAIEALRQGGSQISHVVSILSYGTRQASLSFARAHVAPRSLTEVKTLLAHARPGDFSPSSVKVAKRFVETL